MTVDLPRHRLLVEADAHPGALLRLLEPFAIHEVQPIRLRVDGPADGRIDPFEPAAMHAEIAFAAPEEVAERLRARIDAMVPVRAARLVSTTAVEAAA